MTALWRGSLPDEARRRTTTEIVAVVVDVKAPTLPPPAKTCTCCGGSLTHEEWMTNTSRRPWPGLGMEIAEHGCRGTLAEKINAAPVLLGTETGR